MASSSSTVTSRANKCRREDESSTQDKYTFQGKLLSSQTKHVLMNMVEYIKKEAKKSKGYPNVLERVSKATGKTVYVVKTIHELAFCQVTSLESIRKVHKEFQKRGGNFDSPLKRYTKSCLCMDPRVGTKNSKFLR